MKLNDFKTKFLQDWVQFVLIDDEGKFIESCETLFKLPSNDLNLISQVPFIESIHELLETLVVGQELSFPCINMDLYGFEGFFDFVFYRIDYEGQVCTLWIIMNFSDHYKHLMDLQQQRNESVIQKELIEVEKKNALLAKELLEFKNDELKRTQKLKTDFFSKISHEIRTPLNGILGISELLNDDPSPEKVKSYANTIFQASKHLTSIINDVLDMAKIESSKMTFVNASFDIRQVVTAVTSSFIFLGKEKGIKVSANIGSDVPVILLGDQVRFSQILYNLLSNAVKFTEEGEVTVTIELLSSDHLDCCLRLFISDTGIGIPNERLGKIFEAYEQVEEHASAFYEGTGLGLHIVKQLIELQNGKIAVESIVGRGTTFTIEMPFGISYQTLEDEMTSEEMFDLDLNILIGEDNQLNQKILSEFIKKWGFNSKIVENGQLIIDELHAQSFDLIILDYKMPEMDGLEALKFIRDNFNTQVNSIPVIIFTGEQATDIIEEFNQLGAKAILNKPIEPKVLLQAILETFNKEEGNHNFNLNYAVEMTGGNHQLIHEMISIFVESMPDELLRLENLIASQDREAVKKLIHKIKPNFHYMGLKQAEEELNTLERQFEDNADRKTIVSNIKKFSRTVLNAVNALNKEKNNWLKKV